MTLRLGVVAGGLALLGVAFALMVGDAVSGHDWPGWDEGWAVIAFPLGIPAAVAVALAALRRSSFGAQLVGLTAAVWLWGACVFLLWYAVG
jgi:small neutral amino acid transporter SnatA (MarC family)